MFIKKAKNLNVLWHFIHVLQYYPKFNNEHHTKPSNLFMFVKLKYQTWIIL